VRLSPACSSTLSVIVIVIDRPPKPDDDEELTPIFRAERELDADVLLAPQA
jgi:hypothetical protein